MTFTKMINKWEHLLPQYSKRKEFEQDIIDLIAETIVDEEERFLREFKHIVQEIYN